MKKLLIACAGLFLSFSAISQDAVDPLVQAQKDGLKADLEKADKSIEAKPDKASGYLDRAKALIAIAVFQDSSFALSVENAGYQAEAELKKVTEMVDKKGKPVKEAEEANALLNTPVEGVGRSQLSTAFLNLGVFNYQNQNYSKAYELIWKSSNLSPKDTMSAMYAGVSAQLTNSMNDQALEAYQRYVANGGKDLSILYSVGDIYSVMASKADNESDKKALEDKAIQAVNAALEVYPTNKDLLGTKFNYFVQFKRDNEAKDFLKNAIAENPNDVVSLVNLGIMIERKDMSEIKDNISTVQNAERKEKDLNGRIQSTQDQIDAYKEELKKNEAKLKQNISSAARKQIQQLVDGYKRDIEEFTATLNERKETLKKFQTETGDISTLQAKLEDDKKQYDVLRDEVASYYKKALTIDPNYADALYQLGALYFNYAQEIKQVLNSMDIDTYNKESGNYTNQIKEYYNNAIPYFEKYIASQNDAAVQEIVDQIKKELEKL